MKNFLEINNSCFSCDNCRLICPERAILTDGKSYAIDKWACTQCQLCVVSCPANAIREEKLHVDDY